MSAALVKASGAVVGDDEAAAARMIVAGFVFGGRPAVIGLDPGPADTVPPPHRKIMVLGQQSEGGAEVGGPGQADDRRHVE